MNKEADEIISIFKSIFSVGTKKPDNNIQGVNNIGKRKPKPIPDIKQFHECNFSSSADICTTPCKFTGGFKKLGRVEIETNFGPASPPYSAKVFFYSYSKDVPAALLNMDLSDVESSFIWVMGGRYRLKNLQPFVEVKS